MCSPRPGRHVRAAHRRGASCSTKRLGAGPACARPRKPGALGAARNQHFQPDVEPRVQRADDAHADRSVRPRAPRRHGAAADADAQVAPREHLVIHAEVVGVDGIGQADGDAILAGPTTGRGVAASVRPWTAWAADQVEQTIEVARASTCSSSVWTTLAMTVRPTIWNVPSCRHDGGDHVGKIAVAAVQAPPPRAPSPASAGRQAAQPQTKRVGQRCRHSATRRSKSSSVQPMQTMPPACLPWLTPMMS